MKKLLLGLGVLPLLTLPVISLVSCGQPQKSKLQNKMDEPTLQNQIDKLEDSITKDPNITVSQVFTNINNKQSIDDRKTELEKVFTLPILDAGFSISQIIPTIDENNKTNLSVEITIQKDSSPTETLSKTIVISGLKATASKETTKETTPEKPTKETTTEKPTKETTTEKPTKPEKPTKEPTTKEPTTKEPTIPVVPTIVDLKITAKPSTQVVIYKASADYKSGSNESAKIAALSTVFEGITTENFKNIIVLASSSTITLRANHNFTINGKSTLSSSLAPIIDLKITAIPSTQTVIYKAIVDFRNGGNESAKITALSTVFEGITLETFKNITIATTSNTIILRAKTNFSINGKQTLSSLVAPIVDLKITAIPSTQTTINKAIRDYVRRLIIENTGRQNGNNGVTKITALSTVFEGITSETFKNITIKATKSSGSTPGTIVLTAKSGFTISGKQTLSSSLAPIVDLKITAIPSTQVAINKAIADFFKKGDVPGKITALSTIFSGITSDNFKNITILGQSTSNTIILSAKPGFTINGKSSLSSNHSRL